MSTISKERIVIVGFGWIGQANAIALRLAGYDVSYFDPATPKHHYSDDYAAVYAQLERLASVTDDDSPDTCYIVCVGDRVSEEGEQDIGSIKAALASLADAKGTVTLRSTILPDLLPDLRFDFYVPEFLHEKKAVEECANPYFFVIGKKHGTTRTDPSFFELWRGRAHKSYEGTPREASLIKYLSNLWNSVRIAFVNEFGDAIGRPTDKAHLEEIEHVVNFLFDNRNYLRYGRSFGGHCLPKDTRAFRRWYQKDRSLPLIAGVYESNERHRELEEKYPLMPEWYSKWPDRHISGWKAFRELLYAIRKRLHI